MVGSGSATVVEVAGLRQLVSMDKGHKLEIRPPGGMAVVIESRPITEFSAAVDMEGRLHVAAWLLSRQLMYYTSADGAVFTKSTLFKSDGNLRLKDCMVFAGEGVTVAYVAETEYSDTLICYRFEAGDWEGRRIVEVEQPQQRLAAWQFDSSPGGAAILYSVREPGRTLVFSRPVSGEGPAEPVATINGGLTDFCALTSGGVRQACWLADGLLMVNGTRLGEEPWSREWPCLRLAESGVHCLWMAGGKLCGVQLGAHRAALRPVALRDPLPCMLALPGELRKAVVERATLREPMLQPEAEARSVKAPQQYPSGRELQGGSGELTLADIVRNQAIYLTRMQESLSAMERNVLRMQAEMNRLTKEVSALVRARAEPPRPEPVMRAAAFRAPEADTTVPVEEDMRPVLQEAAEQAPQIPDEPVPLCAEKDAARAGEEEEEGSTFGGA